MGKKQTSFKVDTDSLSNLLMAGRDAERSELLDYIEKVKAAIPPGLRAAQVGLRYVEEWAREREARLKSS